MRIVFILLCIFSTLQHAQARRSVIPGSRYESARAAALGGAYLPIVDNGVEALFYQPAAISKTDDFFVEALNLQMSFNNPYLNNAGVINTGQFSLEKLNQKTFSGFSNAGVQLMTGLAVQGFSFGLLYRTELGAQKVDGVLTYRSEYQLIPAVGFSVRLAKGIVRLGYSLQLVNESIGEITETDPDNASLSYKNGLAEGAGLSHNFGFALTLPLSGLPSLNIVARDIGGTSFSLPNLVGVAKNSSGQPSAEKMTVDIGMGLHYVAKGGGFYNLALTYRDALSKGSGHLLSKISFGFELNLMKLVSVRLGFGEGYPSGGFGIITPRGEIMFTYANQEVGSGFRNTMETRYFAQYRLSFF
ncbi:MAG: hypothetical protein CL678_12940 [Bdellovibrionaceae bacterium]|nr:hypothetical protein [Pseudobdellovibrionaceae bacterium]|tara:strand:+ start:14528 stop:15601 length:1074 start_codon:yes stop_codon:yes gene_type:complete